MKKKLVQRGFTLVEMIIVLSVFMFVIGASLIIFMSAVGQQKETLARQEIINQTSYVMEYMSKALRMAKTADSDECITTEYAYLLTRPSSGYFMGIKFLNYSDNTQVVIDSETTDMPACQEFYLDATTGILRERKSYYPYSSWTDLALTSSVVQINFVRFGLDGTNGCYGEETTCPSFSPKTDLAQPRVTMVFSVQAKGDSQEPEKLIQTTISQRNLNMQ